MGEPPRWRYRYRNFTGAFTLFREAASRDPASLSDLEREGLIQRFEYTFELAWKTLKDRLEHDGVQVATVTPRNVIREAFAAGMIADGQGWLDMLTDRNAMAQKYDRAVFEAVAASIHGPYLHLLETLWTRLAEDQTES
ncbi:MAG: nucleotidyltransferase [Gemmatimonadales bacterium]|nr:nucleotidyltransferase [Gemmatimonadales bacterium]MYG48023.1 nucleotidyltransferase [Gemmatimonadales bacterium]MYK01570.1 nucleotidyltransferase [Candidatus Palauibacter ramosifaciens]